MTRRASVSLSPVEIARGGYDPYRRRFGRRAGRERGCWVYITAVELKKAGFAEGDPAPFYRVWGRRNGSVLLRLYRQP